MFRLTLIFLLTLLCHFCYAFDGIRSGYVEVTCGDSIYFEERGRGEPLVFLHGHSLDHSMWHSQFNHFSRNYRTIAIDFRGYGLSSEQPEAFQFTHLDDLLTVLDSLCIQHAHVIGLSMGAFIAGDMLAVCPNRLLSVTLASGSIRNTHGPSHPMDSDEHARRDVEINRLKSEGVEQMKRQWFEALVSGGGSRREALRRPLWQMISEWSAWQQLNKEGRLYYGQDAWFLLEQKRPAVPVLMLRGETEGKGTKTREEKILPNFRIIVLPDCGHMMNMEQPDLFNQTLENFLNSL